MVRAVEINLAVENLNFNPSSTGTLSDESEATAL